MKTLTEYILESIANSWIFEMAKNRSDLKRTIDGIAQTLFQHWCLVRYCALYDFGNANKDHWCDEVANYIKDIQFTRTKGYDKTRLVKQVLIDELELNEYDELLIEWLTRKFMKEHIIITSDEINRIISDWKNDIINLCNVLGMNPKDDNFISANEYILNDVLTVENR